MNTLVRNRFVAFDDSFSISSKEHFQNVIHDLSSGPGDDLFIVLYTIHRTKFIGFSILSSERGDTARHLTIAKLGKEHGAQGAFVYHMLISEKTVMDEVRITIDVHQALDSSGIYLWDYGYIKNRKLISFLFSRII